MLIGEKQMARRNRTGLIGLLLGSPFALLGVIFLLSGKVGVGLPFLLLGLAAAGSGAVAGRSTPAPAADQDNKSAAAGSHAEPAASAEDCVR